MKRLTFLIVFFAFVYGAYWFGASAFFTRSLDQFTTQSQQSALSFAYADRSLTGFPSRFDVSFQMPRLSLGNLSATTDLIQVFALSYRPNRMIGYIPGPVKLATPNGDLRLSHHDLRASLSLYPTLGARLRELRVAANGLSIANKVSLPSALLAMRHIGEARYEFYAVASDISLPPEVLSEGLPGTIARLELRGIAESTAELNLKERVGQLQRLELRAASLIWGESRLTLTGELAVNPSGGIDGHLLAEASNIAPALDAAQKIFPVGPGALAYGVAAAQNANGDLSMRLDIRDNTAYLGFIPIFRLPYLHYLQ